MLLLLSSCLSAGWVLIDRGGGILKSIGSTSQHTQNTCHSMSLGNVEEDRIVHDESRHGRCHHIEQFGVATAIGGSVASSLVRRRCWRTSLRGAAVASIMLGLTQPEGSWIEWIKDFIPITTQNRLQAAKVFGRRCLKHDPSIRPGDSLTPFQDAFQDGGPGINQDIHFLGIPDPMTQGVGMTAARPGDL